MAVPPLSVGDPLPVLPTVDLTPPVGEPSGTALVTTQQECPLLQPEDLLYQPGDDTSLIAVDVAAMPDSNGTMVVWSGRMADWQREFNFDAPLDLPVLVSSYHLQKYYLPPRFHGVAVQGEGCAPSHTTHAYPVWVGAGDFDDIYWPFHQSVVNVAPAP